MAEVKTKGAKVDFVLSISTKKKFKRSCKVRNTSMAQCLRDYVQAIVKEDSRKC